ncbi:MAG: 5-formyltetrahydrofolate cyclo-ligase [Chthoniobacterales bacterium]|nr:5-formyltetrahydrofolate cyclo-ligase [Chthoniobacterales bacterium]
MNREILEQKRALQKQMRLLLQKMTKTNEEDKKKANWVKQLTALTSWKKAASVLLYAPLASEVDVLNLLELFPKKRFFFPKITQRVQSHSLSLLLPVHHQKGQSHNGAITGAAPLANSHELELYEWNPGALWMRGPYGLREPDPQSWKQVEPQEVDLALIPGLAFDLQGGRLGRGGGFYDRLLSLPSWKGFKVGIAWSWQLVEHVTREPHDVLMDIVITAV